MKKRSIYMLPICTLLFILLLCSHRSTVEAQEVEDEREFDYIEGSEKGPTHWGELKKEWATCKTGALQSPIDISNKRVKKTRKPEKLETHYKPYVATIKNRGHDIMVQWEGDNAGFIRTNRTEYFLRQAHWHTPSEHTINGRRYATELHMVHVSQDGKGVNRTAVVGVLYKIGKPDAFLSKLLRDIISISDKELEEQCIGIVDPSKIIRKGVSRKLYRYNGSLTTPPCTEGVLWSIHRKIRTVSRIQVKALREAVHEYAKRNARPTQPLNKRRIHLYSLKPTGGGHY